MPTALYLKHGSFYSSVGITDSAHPFGPSPLRANSEQFTSGRREAGVVMASNVLHQGLARCDGEACVTRADNLCGLRSQKRNSH
jgi:hypothetical protein